MRGDEMKTRNDTGFWYALPTGTDTVYNGGGYEIGETESYAEPVRMYANISPATGRVQAELFGNLENYDRVIVTKDMSCPIDEDAVLCIDRPPTYSADGKLMYDYRVRRVARGLHGIAIACRKATVS